MYKRQVLGFGSGGSIVFDCFMCASGGCSTSTDGDYKIHLFNSPGTFTVNNNALATVDYVIIAGGGGGGAPQSGGGAGGFRTNFPGGYCGGLEVAKGAYAVVTGGGGTGKSAPSSGPGTKGVDSSAVGLSAAGGGAGGPCAPSPSVTTGGSGAGGAFNQAGGTGNTPDTSPVDLSLIHI